MTPIDSEAHQNLVGGCSDEDGPRNRISFGGPMAELDKNYAQY